MITHELRELGLSEKEAKIYVVLLELGPSVVSDIAKKSGVNRSTVYVILGSLQKRGLVTEEQIGAIKQYVPEQPERLVRHFEETAAQYKTFASTAQKLLPELKSVEKKREGRKKELIKPKVQYFEGQEGMESVYESTLASLGQIRAHASIKGTVPTLARQRRAKGKINVQVIFPHSANARAQIAHNRQDSASELNVYDDKVVFISPSEQHGFIIESKELAKALKMALKSSQKESGLLNKKPYTVAERSV